MYNHIKAFIFLALTIVLANSCRKDNSAFKGRDNAIASFHLTKGNIILKAAITQDSIVITAPESFNLSGAAVAVVLSEHARISPDPASISDWSKPNNFVVTSYNGVPKTYTYSLQRNVISKDGDVVLVTQADVNAFDSLDITTIGGSLTIGKAVGQDTITSLAPLSKITAVKYDVIINPTYAGKTLTGLNNLRTVGSIQIGQLLNLDTIAFPKLTSIVSSLVINGSAAKAIKFPVLKNIDLGMQILATDSLSTMEFPALETIQQDLLVQGNYTPSNLENVNLPALKTVGGNINIFQWTELKDISFANLTKAGSITINSFEHLASVKAPKLQAVSGTVDLAYNINLASFDLSSLQTIGGNYHMDNIFTLTDLNGLKALTSIGGDLALNTLPLLKNLDGLNALKSIGGNMTLSGFDQFEDDNMQSLSSLKTIGGDLIISGVPFKKFSGFALTKIKSLGIYGNGLSTIESIDISKLDILNTLTISNVSTPAVLTGKDNYDCTVSIEYSNVSLVGFKEVKDFSFSYFDNAPSPVLVLPITKVYNNLSISVMGFTKCSLPNLASVDGLCDISIYGPMSLDIPLLTTAGKLNLNTTASEMQLTSLPALQLVDGDVNIATGNYQGSANNFAMPALTRINGTLSLSADSWYTNTSMTNVNGFSALKNVQGITVQYNLQLTDFSGLKNALSSMAADKWKVAGNGYNPTFQDMLDGKYAQP